MSDIFQALKFAPIAVVVIILLILILSGYVKAPPDVAYIISGFRKTRILVGRAGIKIPFLERLDKLSLRMISVDVKTTDFVPNSEYINVKVDATVKIRVGREDELMQLAMANFLNAKEEQIVGKVQDTLEGNMREIIGQMKLSEMVTDRKAFGERVQENALPDLRKMGLELISFNVQSFSDQNGVIDDLGIDNVSRIKKDAAIAKAEADRDVAIKQAEADREANDAKMESEMQIAQKRNELAIKQAELKKDADIKQAEADAAYKIQEREQAKTLETADVNAQIARAEREAELKEKQVLIAKQALDAEVRAQADAERYRQEQEAQAELFRRQKEAEARRYEQEQDAEAVKKAAEAAKFAREQEAAGIAAVGKAEAEATKAKALAEAEGIDKKAEAMQKYGEAAVVEMVMKALPEIAKNVAEPLSKVDKITMYGEGNSAKLLADIVSGTTQVTEGISAGMGIDVKALLAGLVGGKLAAPSVPVINIPAPAGKPEQAEDIAQNADNMI
jgi:flotillin